jgi:hypothetical protein
VPTRMVRVDAAPRTPMRVLWLTHNSSHT